MTKIRSFIYFVFFIGILLFLRQLITQLFPNLPEDSDIWFTSGLLLVVLGVFITEKYFTKSLDVIINIVTLLIVLWTLDSFKTFKLYPALIIYTSIVGSFAVISFLLFNEKKDPSIWSQKIAKVGYSVSTFLGSSKMLFSIVFILSIFNYFVFSLENQNAISHQQVLIISLIVFWGAAILVEPIDRKLVQPIINFFENKDNRELIGKIVKRISPNVLIVEHLSGTHKPSFGEIVIVDNKEGKEGKIIAMYIDEQESEDKKYLQFYILKGVHTNIDKDVFVFTLNDQKKLEVAHTLEESKIYKNRNNIIGTVFSHSNIDVIKIKMIADIDNEKRLEEGDLLYVDFYDHSTKYQIISVETEIESVDGESKKGIKIITAQQIGCWADGEQKFSNANWVPDLNSLVFLESENAADIPEHGENFYRIGLIPKSKYPIYLDFKESVSHHVAIIGKTGTGKSYMAARMIEKLALNGYKVVILEIDQKNSQSLSRYIDQELISSEQTTWTSEDKQKTVGGRTITYKEWKASTNYSPDDNKRVFAINWENQSRTQNDGPLTQTEGAVAIISNVIKFQSEHPDEKICIVMEEAYDFIPESTFGQQDFGQPGVSRISQLVLKCRKHNIGFLIITQRTALVTKTILYQCHTIIALQSFDETSKNFMGAYISDRYLNSMSILPKFRAIIVGKGSTCDKPVIVDFRDRSLS